MNMGGRRVASTVLLRLKVEMRGSSHYICLVVCLKYLRIN